MFGQIFPDAVQAVEYLKRRMIEQERQEQRRKFLEDHQRIHNRRKNEPCIPFLPGHDQETWFAKLNVNGIWKRVFEFLTDPSDVTSAYFTCNMFRIHLEEKRKMMVLPKVLEVLQENEYFQYLGFRFDSCCGPRSCRNAEKKKAESREVLKHRLISKSWKKSVEEVLLLPVDVSQLKSMWDLGTGFWDLDHPIVCQFKKVTDVDNAITKLSSTNSCASLIRFVDVWVPHPDRGDNDVFYSKLMQFLALHGEAVWALHFHQEELGTSHDLHYEDLCNILSCTPHLKALWLQIGWECEHYDFGEGEHGQVDFRNSNARLGSMIAQKSFPTLPELEHLSVSSWPSQYDSLTAGVLIQNMNLKSVFLDDWDLFNKNNAIPPFVWDVLGNLRLKNFGFCYNYLSPHFMDAFQRLGQFDWPLECLSVYDRNWTVEPAEVGASIVFIVLSRFNDTLEEFELETTEMRLVNDRTRVAVDFPNLKEFDLPKIGLETKPEFDCFTCGKYINLSLTITLIFNLNRIQRTS